MANNYRQFSAALAINESERQWCIKRLAELKSSEVEASFEFEIEKTEIWFYAEESGTVEHVANFVQEYLAKFHPSKCWSMSWADTCSRMVLGEFGGGAVFVTAKDQKYIDTESWAQKQAEEFALEPQKVEACEPTSGLYECSECGADDHLPSECPIRVAARLRSRQLRSLEILLDRDPFCAQKLK